MPGTWKRRLSRQEEPWGYLMIAPLMLGFGVFYYLAMAVSFLLGFTEWNVLTPPTWIGLKNYEELFHDELFLKTLWNTTRYTLLAVPITLVVSLLLALALNAQIRLRAFFRLAFFLPVLTMPVAISYVWKWVYHPTYGLLNGLLKAIGVARVNWLGNVSTAMPSVVAVAVWMAVGYQMVIFLAGLQNIPAVYYEAAHVDGASGWKRFWRITLPLLTPTVFFNFIISLIGSFQVFDIIYGLTKGGPMESTRTMVFSIWDDAFHYFRMGRASAEAWILFAIILGVTIVQIRMQGRWVYQE